MPSQYASVLFEFWSYYEINGDLRDDYSLRDDFGRDRTAADVGDFWPDAWTVTEVDGAWLARPSLTDQVPVERHLFGKTRDQVIAYAVLFQRAAERWKRYRSSPQS
jgi:hypothetical protein